MKKTTKRILRAALVIVLFILVCSRDKVMAQLPFLDGFESGNFITGGWTVSGGATVSSQSPSQGLYCAQGAATYSLLKSIPSISDSIVYVEFDVKASQTNTTCLIFRIRDNNLGTSAGFFLNNLGQIMGVNGPTPPIVLLNYSVDQWYKIRFEMNMNTETYDLYINNLQYGNDYNFYTPGFGMPVDFSWSSVAATGSAWIDAVYIYTGVATGRDETVSHKKIWVSPNPATEILNVKTDYNSLCYAIIYNTLGERMFSKALHPSDHIVDVSKVRSGLYLLNITDETGRILHSEKIVRQ
jgi:hypothetical protein